MKKHEAEDQNEYAENVKEEPLYILDVESGRKGYFCIGCKNEMQAVKTKIRGRKSYFRHDPNDVKKSERKCTFSNQDYRHDQAVLILNRIKRIRVPTLYKYPPEGIDGKAFQISDSKFIDAKYTKSEITFYETDSGEVKFGKNPEIDSRNLLIRPDVTFFNAQNKPILLIEIVVTHKIDVEKLTKIRRLGINTVQITIPKDSLENIEKSFSKTNYIKWVYNYEEERTKYIFSPKDDSERVSQIDEFQKRFFEETFDCRKFQIRDLVRTITRYLGSKQYREIEKEFRSEISRVEENTERLRNKLATRREETRKRISRKFEKRTAQIESERARIEIEERKFRDTKEEYEDSVEKQSGDLEGRYINKREELEDKLREIRKSFLGAEDFERSEHSIREQEREIESEIRDTESRIGDIVKSREGLPRKYKRLEKFEQYRVESEKEKIKEDRTKVAREYRENKKNTQIEFEENRESSIRKIEERNTSRESKLSSRIKTILNAGRLFNDWNERTNTLHRNRAALECLRKGTYKNWN
ncbi:hypothetical protein [Gillisia sp. JM1]|uniref:hypothetical protein n=1 Tax=Gillisia sp. JM1 TaxID=1283286 RepID=UPI00040759E3|nr:hypothetical protein [Gillisia sp. JM1]